jgi:hypothetical protein
MDKYCTLEQFEEFMTSVNTFMNSVVKLTRHQKEINTVLQKQCRDNIQLIQIQQATIKDLNKQVKAHKTLLIEHETRLLEIEKYLRNDYTELAPLVLIESN